MAKRKRGVARPAETASAVIAAPRPPLPYAAHVAGALLLLLLTSLHPLATVTSTPEGHFQDPDAAFHAHRVERTVAEGRLLPPAFDAFESFPEGGRAVWPPLHDACLALLARLGGSSAGSPSRGMHVAAAFPVLELLAALLVAAALARSVSGERGGALAAWLFAAMPYLARRGAFGEIDHNVTELLGALLLVALARRLSANGSSGKALLAHAVLWAAALLLALGFFAGLVVAAGFAAAGAVLGAGTRREMGRAALLFGAGFAVAAEALPFLASARLKPIADDPWRLGPVYALLLAIAAAAFGLAALLLGPRERAPRVLAVVVLLVSAGGGLAQPAAAWRGVLRGLGFFGGDPWLASIDEFQPLTSNLPALYGALPGLLAAACAVALALRPVTSVSSRLLPLVVPFTLFTLFAIRQQRYLAPAAALAAAAGGAAWGALAGSRARWTSAAFAFGLLFGAPYLTAFAKTTLRHQSDPSLSPASAAAAGLRAATPDPGTVPQWGVLASWDQGHAILRESGRAVAVNNFGSFHPGFEAKLSILLETSPAAALAEMRRLKLRYLVAYYPALTVYGTARALGRNPLEYLVDDPEKREVRYLGTAKGERTLLFRLHKHQGKPFPEDSEADRLALASFRKLWESAELLDGLPAIAIHEVEWGRGEAAARREPEAPVVREEPRKK